MDSLIVYGLVRPSEQVSTLGSDLELGFRRWGFHAKGIIFKIFLVLSGIDSSFRRPFLIPLQRLAPLCSSGGTNIVTSPNEKYGGLLFDHNNAKWYHEFLEKAYLMKIQSKGGAYTWSNQRSEKDEICEKLDRVLCSLEWSFIFTKAIAIVDVAIASDHAHILLFANGMMKKVKKRLQARVQIDYRE
ncbi:hypothetical protein V6N11_056054 [Hibiscus sabdariffa]|uniref:Transposase IS200-like domain-containing protein n=1 Tax=Hibiscus sabdariffa TaxID=183260 RepID=A0ABR2T3I3_9ROSI